MRRPALTLVSTLLLPLGLAAAESRGFLEAEPAVAHGFGPGRDYFGGTLASGDLDRDGFPEILVGASGEEPLGAGTAGRVFVYSGRDGSLWGALPEPGGAEGFGRSLACGDVDADGHADIIVGAPYTRVPGAQSFITGGGSTDPVGCVFVYSGKDGRLLKQLNGYYYPSQFGDAVAAADLNQDGYADVIVGAPLTKRPRTVGGAGAVHAYSGKDFSLLSQVHSSGGGQRLGDSLAIADVNQDGHPDVIAGAPGLFGNPGSVFVYSGKDGQELLQVDASQGGAEMGDSVAAGDVDGDGHADVIAGAPRYNHAGERDSGAVFVFSGKDGSPMQPIFPGERDVWSLGQAVAAADLDRNGRAEIVASSERYRPATRDYRWRVQVFSGSGFQVISQRESPLPGEVFGWALHRLDVNRDGAMDLLAGAPHAGSAPGTAYLYFGGHSSLPKTK